MTRKKVLVAGLGNVGLEYEMTRHNFGFLVVDRLAKEFNLSFKPSSFVRGSIAKGVVDQVEWILLKPTTLMNLSGQALFAAMRFFAVDIENVIVVVDDIYLPFSAMRLRQIGSAGGHNGLKNVEKQLGTDKYFRLKMGVGEPREGQDLSDYVLNDFSPQEEARLPELCEKGCQVLKMWVENPGKATEMAAQA